MLRLEPITPNIGAEVIGIDLTQSIPSGEFEKIYDAWITSTILLFRNQNITPQQQVAIARRFGQISSYTRSQFSEEEHPEILVLSNITRDGRLIGSPVSGRVWHTDGHYLEDPPAGSLLYAIETPTAGGDTWFANMFIAYEELPQATKEQISGLKVVISRVQSRSYNYPERPAPTEEERRAWHNVSQPVVREHPVSRRKALYVGGNVPWQIEGMPEEESGPLVTFLQEFAVRRKYIYRHIWRPGDIIIWDNRSAMHRATYYDASSRRLMHRVTFGERLN